MIIEKSIQFNLHTKENTFPLHNKPKSKLKKFNLLRNGCCMKIDQAANHLKSFWTCPRDRSIGSAVFRARLFQHRSAEMYQLPALYFPFPQKYAPFFTVFTSLWEFSLFMGTVPAVRKNRLFHQRQAIQSGLYFKNV